jgi:hypothetical protein
MTTDERFEVLSALLDREPVDPGQLRVAIDDPEGRAALVDFVRLRAQTQRSFDVEDADGTPAASRSQSGTWLARAAALLVTLGLGAAGGAWWVEHRERRPPAPTQVVQFVPGVDWK